MKSRAALVLATWFGCGFWPLGPGTAGSLGAVAAAWALHAWLGYGMAWHLALAAALFVPAVWAAGETARQRNAEDPGLVVVDEAVGQWIALAGAGAFTATQAAAAFVLFRLFDIVKPWPVRALERLPGGWGIVADDAAAGAYAALVLAAGRAVAANVVQS
jgi:phosphatidylglycerophosphatase A